MADTLSYYQLIQQNLADSTTRNNYFEGKFIGTFLQHGQTQIVPVLNSQVSIDYISYILLFFIAGIALVWRFLPERLFSLFNISTKKGFSRTGDVTIKTPGLLISLFFFLNFIFSFSIFLFLLLKTYAPDLISGSNNLLIIAYILVFIILLHLYRLFFIKSSGFIFKTDENSSQQLNIYINTENALGVLLIPVLLFSLYTSIHFILLTGILLFFIFLIIRWLKTFFIGMSISGFSVLHLILYLCTLEIIPVLIGIKLVENSGIF
jgi:hypothetical protein